MDPRSLYIFPRSIINIAELSQFNYFSEKYSSDVMVFLRLAVSVLDSLNHW